MVRRTTIEFDEALLAKAQQVLGTRGVKDTVDRALHEVIRADRRRRLATRLLGGTGVDFDDATAVEVRTWRQG